MILKKVVLVILLFSFVFCEQPKKQEFVLKTSDFQTEIDGKKTDLYLLKNEQIEVYITNYGARIVSLLSLPHQARLGSPRGPRLRYH